VKVEPWWVRRPGLDRSERHIDASTRSGLRGSIAEACRGALRLEGR
jgi:hypothetical protein